MSSMYPLSAFEYVEAASIQDALRETESGAVIKAGGVDLLDRMKEGIDAPKRLVNIRHVRGLDRIAEDNGGLRIGPLVTLTQLHRSETVRKRYTALAEAAEHSATPQIRNMATIGGNLLQRPRCWYFRSADFHCLRKGGERCFAQDGENEYHAIFDNQLCAIVHPSSLAIPLIAFGAQVELTSAKGKRNVTVEDFFVTPERDVTREAAIQPGEVITAITLPPPPQGTVSAYYKQGEKESFDWPLAAVAVALQMSGSTCNKANVVLGFAAPTPLRAKAVEAKLDGVAINEDLARSAAKEAIVGATPMTNNAYKLPIFEAIVRRTIVRATKGAPYPTTIDEAAGVSA
ncbi:MAG TPA: xanthine dehydrogenase family protein subunit M [Terriglobales bacterium]|nr:xanthine dehydrogenase family protein subunit M [Terriglobales bacterium]